MTRTTTGNPVSRPSSGPPDEREVERREPLVLVPGEDPREAVGERRDVLVLEVRQARRVGHDGDRLAGAGRREGHQPVDAGRSPDVALAGGALLLDQRPASSSPRARRARRPSGPSTAGPARARSPRRTPGSGGARGWRRRAACDCSRRRCASCAGWNAAARRTKSSAAPRPSSSRLGVNCDGRRKCFSGNVTTACTPASGKRLGKTRALPALEAPAGHELVRIAWRGLQHLLRAEEAALAAAGDQQVGVRPVGPAEEHLLLGLEAGGSDRGHARSRGRCAPRSGLRRTPSRREGCRTRRSPCGDGTGWARS